MAAPLYGLYKAEEEAVLYNWNAKDERSGECSLKDTYGHSDLCCDLTVTNVVKKRHASELCHTLEEDWCDHLIDYTSDL